MCDTFLLRGMSAARSRRGGCSCEVVEGGGEPGMSSSDRLRLRCLPPPPLLLLKLPSPSPPAAADACRRAFMRSSSLRFAVNTRTAACTLATALSRALFSFIAIFARALPWIFLAACRRGGVRRVASAGDASSYSKANKQHGRQPTPSRLQFPTAFFSCPALTELAARARYDSVAAVVLPSTASSSTATTLLKLTS